jgi:hypothetical protein
MLGRKEWDQLEFFTTASLGQLVPDERRARPISWLREEVSDCIAFDDDRPESVQCGGTSYTRRFAYWDRGRSLPSYAL